MISGPISMLFDALPLPALLITDSGRIAMSNPLATELFGPDLSGRPAPQVLRQPALLAALDSIGEGESVRTVDISHRTRDGHEADLRAQLALIDPGGTVLVTFTDLSAERVGAEIRRDFVANVSHELRTPLTAISGLIETLQGPARDDPAARAHFLAIMGRETDRMTRLVDDLLSLSRVESDQRRRPTGVVDLGGVLRQVVDLLAAVAEQSGAMVTIEIDPDLPEIPGDAGQLRQVGMNLIENAIKYGGAHGPVTVTLGRNGETGLVLKVKDEGEGIAPDHLPRLTERFYRVDRHRSREVGGTGLGLAIVKHIVQRHRGRLTIDSRLGQGTLVTVELPVR